MPAPAQVRKQSEDIKKFYEQNGDQPGDQPGDQTSPVEGDEESDETGGGPAPAGEGGQPANPTVQEDENSETYAQRWRSLQGSYNAAVRQIEDRDQRLKNLEQLVASMQSSDQNQPTTPTPTYNPQPTTLLSDEERDEYGDSIEVMRKVTQEVLSPLMARFTKMEQVVANLQTTMVPQVQAVTQRQQMSAEQQFWSQLSTLVPNWQDINAMPEFHNWLLQIDPMTGSTRQAYLEDAQQALDAHRVSAFFDAWATISGKAPLAQPTVPTAVPANELEKQIVPGRTRGSGPLPNKEAKIYTPADIKKFYADVAAGRYKGRDQDRARIERDIFAAQSENRIASNT